ncbi:hypothetical protein CEXT_627331 [Caerostris extrusa]|uniref:Uncharacterized protein n=1 Tax=Caerostris extrusa TaxID=172846 RepID=A0AAV4U2V3_CAEEX|nr:hypothetical protein CEXT_627331 [Caerostris extrusa]
MTVSEGAAISKGLKIKWKCQNLGRILDMCEMVWRIDPSHHHERRHTYGHLQSIKFKVRGTAPAFKFSDQFVGKLSIGILACRPTVSEVGGEIKGLKIKWKCQNSGRMLDMCEMGLEN